MIVIVEGKPRQTFYPTIEALADAALATDLQLLPLSKGAVYHGCASYLPGGRKKNHVHRIKSLWLDIDAGQSKPYDAPLAAYHATVRFCTGVGLPLPLFVGSGGGLHVYWPLSEPIDRARWEPLARALKRTCEAHDLHADPARTADCASILRPVGTHNHKHGAVVQCGPMAGLFDVAELERVLHPDAPAPVRRASTLVEDKWTNVHSKEQVNFDELADRCAQVGGLKVSGGNLPEPLWYSVLGVLAHCHDGDRFGHEWSSGYPNYTPEETQGRLDRAAALTGPTTCAHFRSINAAGCEGCPFAGQAKTPLDTLRLRPTSHEPSGKEGRGSPVEKRDNQPPAQGALEVVNGHHYEGFDFFQYAEDGSLSFIDERPNGNPRTTLISRYPLYFSSINVGESTNINHSVVLNQKLPHMGWQTFELTGEQIGGQGLPAHLSKLGVMVSDIPAFKKFYVGSINKLRDMREGKVDTTQYEQFGWKDAETRFLYGDRLYAADRVEIVPVSQMIHDMLKWLTPQQGGSLDGWSEAASRLFKGGSEGQSLAISASYAAPIIRFTNQTEGGTILSLVTRIGGSGKTTALLGALTVWGTNPRALALTSIDTKVTKGISLGLAGNLPIFFDEFNDRDPDAVRDFCVWYTSGMDKMRGTSEGTIRRAANAWQTMLISASNISLVDLMLAKQQSKAQAMRILECPVQLGGKLDMVDAAANKTQLLENGGHAGDAYLRYLVLPETIRWVKAMLPVMQRDIIKRGKFVPIHRFWVQALSAIGVASIIMEQMGLVTFSPERIMAWAVDYFAAARVYGQLDEDPEIEYTNKLAGFLNAHHLNTLVVPRALARGMSSVGDYKLPLQALFIRREMDTGRTMIDKTVILKWLSQFDIGWRDFFSILRVAGIATGTMRYNLGAGTVLSAGMTECLVVDGHNTKLSGITFYTEDPPSVREKKIINIKDRAHAR